MKELKTWEDLAQNYSLVLFNNCINLGRHQEVLEEWLENHTCEHKEECDCEVFQWYAIAIGDLEAERLNEKYNLDIFFSDYLQLYILPVYHYGTSWDYVDLNEIE